MKNKFLSKFILWSVVSLAVFSAGCAVDAKNSERSDIKAPDQKTNAPKDDVSTDTEKKDSAPKKTIDFAPNSPADTIRVFYLNLREKKFREAIMMTNLRVAVEGLTEAEVQDLKTDFEPLAAQVPAELQISGEIIMADKATVTVKFPNEETGALEDKVFNLKRENDAWVYLMADDATEAQAKKEGKNYFFALRQEVHHSEAKAMLDRVMKAEMVYALQNGGSYTDMATLVAKGLLPADAQSADSTGYNYSINVAGDQKNYTASAVPAVYGKTGKLSFLLQVDEKGKTSGIKSKDNKGAALKN